jgi:hypothetical protein
VEDGAKTTTGKNWFWQYLELQIHFQLIIETAKITKNLLTVSGKTFSSLQGKFNIMLQYKTTWSIWNGRLIIGALEKPNICSRNAGNVIIQIKQKVRRSIKTKNRCQKEDGKFRDKIITIFFFSLSLLHKYSNNWECVQKQLSNQQF